ncbi:amphi-Trp domain-containing protein [Halomarina rubra]|uniref:Amphi-Trp domain-containing protein n=1 Tax=Halomarina rubra TaxID=2071873 RepID=A0ABD6B014_9EURY|nr:amphi-Trp domain-containing protein [Halomarina rubra]
MEETLFKSESTLDRSAIADHLRAVADKLDAGEPIVLTAGEETLSLEVPARPTFEVKAERETGSGPDELSVEFELEWDDGQDGGEAGGEFSVE